MTKFVCIDCETQFDVTDSELEQMKTKGYPKEYPDSYARCPACVSQYTTELEYYTSDATLFSGYTFECGEVYSTLTEEGRYLRACVETKNYVGIVHKTSPPSESRR